MLLLIFGTPEENQSCGFYGTWFFLVLDRTFQNRELSETFHFIITPGILVQPIITANTIVSEQLVVLWLNVTFFTVLVLRVIELSRST